MAQLLIRNLPDEVKSELRRRAGKNGRSMEAEARTILVDVILPASGDPVLLWLGGAEKFRTAGPNAELPHVERQAPRGVSLE